MLFLGLIFLVIVLGVLLAIPRTNAFVSAHKGTTAMVVLGYLVVLVLHPYAFGIRGRIAEHLFERHIHLGMTRDEVIRWADRVGWDKSYTINTQWQMHEPYSELNDGRLDITFIDGVTFCVAGGKDYQFYFSPDWKVTEWRIEPWSNAC